MHHESKQEILERRKEIEQELADLLAEIESEFSLQDIQNIIYHEEDNDDMMQVVAIFDRGNPLELSNVLELVADAWNYFPHESLGGLSPNEIILKELSGSEK